MFKLFGSSKPFQAHNNNLAPAPKTEKELEKRVEKAKHYQEKIENLQQKIDKSNTKIAQLDKQMADIAESKDGLNKGVQFTEDKAAATRAKLQAAMEAKKLQK